VILLCESDDELYPITAPSTHHNLVVVAVNIWQQRLGHPGCDSLPQALRQTEPASIVSLHSCEACCLGKSTRLPFANSHHMSYFPFHLVHCDIWTSPVQSVSGLRYYLVILNDYSHIVWTFPLHAKSDALLKIQNFSRLVQKHYNLSILNLQIDNGCEFDNHAARSFLNSNRNFLRMSCPYTSLRTLNDTVCTLLQHASMPYTFWAEYLSTVTFLVNRGPCRP
jgi:hypothetical protein